MTEIEVVRLRAHEGLLSLPKAEQDQQMLTLIRGKKNPRERMALMTMRELLLRAPPRTHLGQLPANVRASNLLKRGDVCARTKGKQPVEGRAIKGLPSVSVSARSSGCGIALNAYTGPTPVAELVHRGPRGDLRVTAERFRGLETYLEHMDEWERSSLRMGASIRPPEVPEPAPPRATETKRTPLALPGPFIEGAPDIRRVDWKRVRLIAPDSVSVIADDHMRRISPHYYRGPTSPDFIAEFGRWQRENDTLRLRALTRSERFAAEVALREHLRVLEQIAKVPAAAERAATLAELEEALPPALWKKLTAKVRANRAFLEAQLNNSCPHVETYRRIRKEPRSQRVLELLQMLTEMLEPGFKDVRGRWITCTNCEQPAICPHALRDVTLTARGAGESVRRKVLAEYEVKNTGGSSQSSLSRERVCSVCAEVLFYDTHSFDLGERVARTTMANDDRAAVRKELQIATNQIRAPSASPEDIVELGEDVVGRLYIRALAAIRRDRTASESALAARGAAALALYTYAYVTSVVKSTPGLGFAARTKPGRKPPDDRELGFRMFLHRYSQLLAAIPGENGDVPGSGVVKIAREARGARSADPQALRGQFKEALSAVGRVRAPLRDVSPVDNLLANMPIEPFFVLLAKGRAEFDPKFSLKKFKQAGVREQFQLVVGAPPSDFVAAKDSVRPKRRLWKISPDWLPEGKGSRWLRLWKGLTEASHVPPLEPSARVPAGAYRYAADLRVWGGAPRMREHLKIKRPTAVLTKLGERRKFLQAQYAGKPTATAATRNHAVLVDQFSKGFSGDGAWDASDREAVKAFAERALQRAFYTMYTTRCPVDGAHSWKGTPPAPLKCERCKIPQDALYAALRASGSGEALSKVGLEYYKKFMGVSRIGERAELPVLTLALSGDLLPPCAKGKTEKRSPVVDASKLAKRFRLSPRKLLALGANDGLTAGNLERAEIRGDAFAASSVRAHAFELVRALEVVRNAKTRAKVEPWVQKVLAAGGAPAKLPTLALNAPKHPLSDLHSRWCAASMSLSESDLHLWILSVYLSACLYLAESKLGESFVRISLERAIERSGIMLIPTGESSIRAYFSREAQRISVTDSTREETKKDLSETGLLQASAADIHYGLSDYQGENEENSELPEELPSVKGLES